MKNITIILISVLLIGCSSVSSPHFKTTNLKSKPQLSQKDIQVLLRSPSNIKATYNEVLKDRKKGKYETSEEYKSRIKNKNYYTVIELEGKGKYFPDQKLYRIDFWVSSPLASWMYQYKEGLLDDNLQVVPHEWIYLQSFNTKTKLIRRNSIESNAYGTTVEVESKEESGYSILPTNLKALVKSSSSLKIYDDNYLSLIMPVSKKMAMEYDKHTFKLKAELLLTELDSSMFQITYYDKATIDYPYRTTNKYDAVNGEISKLIIYNNETKKVLFSY